MGVEEKISKLHTGLAYGHLNTTLRFDGTTEVDLEMTTTSLAGTWRLNDDWTLRAGLGRILEGSLKPESGTTQEVQPGTLYSLGLEYMVSTGQDLKPFIHATVMFGGSSTTIEDPVAKADGITDYNSSDLRFNARATWIVNRQVFPYISTSFFAGPVNWTLDGSEVVGSDIYHYQTALGAALQLGGVSVFTEWSGIGEKTLIAGLSYGW